MHTHIWLWIESLLNYWWALMSCAVFTLIGAYVLAFKKSSTWALWVTFGAAVFMLLVASFLAWKDEHVRVVDLEGKVKTPEFRLTIGSAWWGPGARDHRLFITVGALLENPVGPPSAAVAWSMELKFRSKIVTAQIPLPSGVDRSLELTGKHGEKLVLRAAKYLPERSLQPIPTGGALGGWLEGSFKGVSTDDIYEQKPTLIVSCLDAINHQKHSISYPLGEGPKGITIPGE